MPELTPPARTAIWVSGIGAAAVLALYFLGRSKQTTSSASSVGLNGPPNNELIPYEPTDHVVTFDNGTKIVTEVVRTPQNQARGLMFRQSMPENNGMLFVYNVPQRNRSLWMRNTRIALDGLFIDENGIVVGIIENLVPMSDEIRSVVPASKYILETNAGWAKRHGVHVGSHTNLRVVSEK